MAVDKLVDSTQLDSDLTSVANAIRTKGGTSAQLAFPNGFVSAIDAIPTGGTLITKTITENGTYNASSDNADGYSSVTVNVAPTLPAEYQQVEYIENQSNAYITLSDIVFDLYGIYDDIKFVAECSSLARYGTSVGILMGFSGSGASWCGMSTSNVITLGSNVNFTELTPATKYTYQLIFDGTQIQATINNITKSRSGTTTAQSPFTIFNGPNPSGGTDYPCMAKIYGLKVYHTISGVDHLIHDIVPCYRISDTQIGLYDLQEGIFFLPSTRGQMAKGSDVLTDAQTLSVLLGE